MATRQLDALEQRLIDRGRALAQQYSAGQITLDGLRDSMRQEVARAITAAVLSGTGAQRNADIDALIQSEIGGAWQELDALVALIQNDDVNPATISTRLEAFADNLEQAQDAGAELAARDDVSPLVPVAIGAGLAALLGLARRGTAAPQAPTQAIPGGRVSLPRVDGGQIGTLFNRLQSDMDALSAQFAAGDLSVDDWHAEMQRQIRRAHGAMYRAGRGASLTQDDIRLLNQRLSRQFDYLNRWRDELSGSSVRNEAAIRARARLYLNASNASLQDGRGAAIGLPPLPAVPGDGTTICRTNCKCTWRIVQLDGAGNYDCYWRLRPAEHCPTCEARAVAWSPIRARNGQWQPFQTIGLFD